MRVGVVSAWLWAALCTFVWLSMAFLVAYPEAIVNFDFHSLREEFFGSEGIERLFIPLLVVVDIGIDWVLGHRRLKDRAGLTCLFMAIFYGIIAGVVPYYNHALSDRALFWMFAAVLLMLAVPRFLSFFQAPKFRAVD